MKEHDIVALYGTHRSLQAVKRHLGMTWHQVRKLYLEAVGAGRMKPLPVGRKRRDEMTTPEHVREPGGRAGYRETLARPMPRQGEIRRYILTCAQNATKIHRPTWENLKALAAHYDADILVSRFTYMKVGLGAHGDKGDLTRAKYFGVESPLWWDPELDPFLCDDRVRLAPNLIWHGEMNTLPTAKNPLSGFEVYAGTASSILPHPRIAMRSVPTLKKGHAKFLYTTGTITERNYIQRKAGLMAEFHHCYGALLVEIDGDGNWWCRQINADSEGTIYDLNVMVSDGEVAEGVRAEAILWPDLHAIEMPEPNTAFMAAFRDGGILDTLRPKTQFIGDVASFRGRSHHELKSTHRMFKTFHQGEHDILREVKMTGRYMRKMFRDWCHGYVVWSNHDDHFSRWADEQNGMRDPVNAELWLDLNARILNDIRKDRPPTNPVRHALEIAGEHDVSLSWDWLPSKGEYVICPDKGGGIEMSMHGHLGARGSRGTPAKFAAMGRKACIGHHHYAGIWDGIYVAGTFGDLSPDWTTGPSDWSHSLVLVHPNGKRQILTIWEGKAWAV